LHRGGVGEAVGDRIDEQLKAQARATPVTRDLGGDGSEVASGAVAADREAAGVDSELGAILCEPGGRREAVLDSRGVAMLGASR
jgi:hypothetical protein